MVKQMFTQVFNRVMPCEGVGEGGMGTDTGTYSFHGFSHFETIAKSPSLPKLPIMSPPCKAWMQRVSQLALDPRLALPNNVSTCGTRLVGTSR
jgi:hypothetical protein